MLGWAFSCPICVSFARSSGLRNQAVSSQPGEATDGGGCFLRLAARCGGAHSVWLQPGSTLLHCNLCHPTTDHAKGWGAHFKSYENNPFVSSLLPSTRTCWERIRGEFRSSWKGRAACHH